MTTSIERIVLDGGTVTDQGSKAAARQFVRIYANEVVNVFTAVNETFCCMASVGSEVGQHG